MNVMGDGVRDMALTLSVPGLGVNGKYHTAWRVVLVSLSLAFPLAVIAAWFVFVPFANNAIEEALKQGGVIFISAVIVPSGVFMAITMLWGARILWRASEGSPAEDW